MSDKYNKRVSRLSFEFKKNNPSKKILLEKDLKIIKGDLHNLTIRLIRIEINLSIKISTRVWQNSSARGGALLVLLAIADHADDRGIAWPGIDLLAKKSRQTGRHVTRCLKQLADTGEIKIHAQRGPHGTNLYEIMCFPKPIDISPINQGLQGDKCVPEMSPEPSEPSEPSESLTHTASAMAMNTKTDEWPSKEEVVKHSRTYVGNSSLGIPSGAISAVWAQSYWSWRTFDAEHWPGRWQEEMFSRFEREWQKRGSTARGEQKEKSVHNTRLRQPGEPPPSPVFKFTLDMMKIQ